MTNNFNFITLKVEGFDFNFSDIGSSPYYNFNFTEPGYDSTLYDFNFGEIYNIYNILKGSNNNFLAIWADFDAGLENGKMYVSSDSAFSVVNLSSQSVDDYYTTTHIGRANEALEHEDIVDLNVK